MSIKNKLISSFGILVFLLFVAIVVKFFAIRRTHKQLSALSGVKTSSEEVDELKLKALKEELAKKFSRIKGLHSDTAPLLVLETCLDVSASLREDSRALFDLLEAKDPAQAEKLVETARGACARMMARADLFGVRRRKEFSQSEAFIAFSGPKPGWRFFSAFLRPRRKTCDMILTGLLPIKRLNDSIIASLGPSRFRLVEETRKKRRIALRRAKAITRLCNSSGRQDLRDIAVQLQPALLSVLGTQSARELRTAWAELKTAFETASSMVPPPDAHPLAGKLSKGMDATQFSWNDYVKSRLEIESRLEKGSRELSGFSREAANIDVLIRKLLGSVIKIIAKRTSGPRGAADEIGDHVAAALDDLDPKTLLAGRQGRLLAVHFDKQAWKRVYDEQLSDLTFMTAIFAIGVVLAVVLSLLTYRDINHPIEILKNSLNNLCMGGEKRRINLKIPNEIGALIEAYNRYLDNLTSSSKRLVECPSCRNPYEMGDSFCRQCGRKLRFDSMGGV